jgi:hypothetical protein
MLGAEILLLWLAAFDGAGYRAVSIPPGLWWMVLPSFLPYLGALYLAERGRGPSLRVVLLVSLALRLPFYALGPALSDDLFRYVWDGQVQQAGISPYTFAPDSPVLLALRDANWPQINHPELRTPYPPVAQVLFWLGSLLTGEGWGVKLVLGATELAGVWGIGRLLEKRGESAGLALGYAWNPLIIIEFAWSGHIDAAALGFFGVALWGLLSPGGSRWSRYVGGFFFGLAVWVKYLPLLALPALWKGVDRGARRGLLAAPLVLAVALPYYLGAGESSAGSLGVYARRWVFNDSGHALLYKASREAIDQSVDSLLWTPFRVARRALDPQTFDGAAEDSLTAEVSARSAATLADRTRFARFQMASYASRGLSLLLLLVIGWIALKRAADPWDAIAATFTGFLFLAPTVHPWYVSWGVFFLPRTKSPALLALSALVLLSYLSHAKGWNQETSVLLLEYVPVALLLLWRPVWRAGGAILRWKRSRARAAA